MCTIGAVFADGGIYTFKQCDLTVKTTFYEPVIRGGTVQYVAFTRDGRPGLWAGINQYGVGFTAADAYTNTPYNPSDADVNALFQAYEKSLTFPTARAAADFLQAFYRNYNQGKGFPAPDIALHTGQGQAIFTEYTPGPCCQASVREVVSTGEPFFASTNHFRIQPDGINYADNHSTYLRLLRGEEILSNDPSKAGVMALLTDQYYGPTELSICRETIYSGEYFTQATALVYASTVPGNITVDYQINGNPRNNPLTPYRSGFVTASPKLHLTTRTDGRRTQPLSSLPAGFFYVDQANYAIVQPKISPGLSYLYSDSATSCIIVIVVGADARGLLTVALAHLDSPDCIDAYFSQVLDATFVGKASVYAQGANPPENTTAQENAAALKAALAEPRPWSVAYEELALLQGDPRLDNRGDYGIDLRTITVSNQPFALELLQRDPTGGVQVLFAIMRRQMTPPIQVRDALEPFDPALVAELVRLALIDQKDPNDPTTAFTYIINLLSEEVRQTWSTTPEYEADWFSDEMKQACCFALTYGCDKARAASARGWGKGVVSSLGRSVVYTKTAARTSGRQMKLLRQPKYRGMLPPGDRVHAAVGDPSILIAPTYVDVPGGKHVPQYSPTVRGASTGYDPANDCSGNFMSFRFQPNNNCYNYSTNIASNSFAQPGRMHGFFLKGAPTGPDVVKGAAMDGLIAIPTTVKSVVDLRKYVADNPAIDSEKGHFVALLISPADTSVDWDGDYHWVRCDDNINLSSWSQKDGGDQVTNFDFAGNPITDPSQSNWKVNQGPQTDPSAPADDVVIAYDFYCYMYAPSGTINLI